MSSQKDQAFITNDNLRQVIVKAVKQRKNSL